MTPDPDPDHTTDLHRSYPAHTVRATILGTLPWTSSGNRFSTENKDVASMARTQGTTVGSVPPTTPSNFEAELALCRVEAPPGSAK
jgi:hypothetical protein